MKNVANTAPIAKEFVKYGKKNTVWYAFCNGLIDAKATDINNAISVDTGTDIKAKIKVLIKQSKIDTYGIVNNLIMFFGGSPIDFIGTPIPWANRLVIIVYEVWSGLPFKILILFSALQSVNKQYYDAAKVDGASKNTTLWKVTVPLISPMLSYLLITGLMGGLKSYSAILGIYGDKMGPVRNEMNTMVGYIYACIETAVNTVNPGAGGGTGKAAAASLILFGIIMVFTAINLYVSKKKVHY